MKIIWQIATLRPSTPIALCVGCISAVTGAGWSKGFNRTRWSLLRTIHTTILETARWPTLGVARFVRRIRAITVAWWSDIAHGLQGGTLYASQNNAGGNGNTVGKENTRRKKNKILTWMPDFDKFSYMKIIRFIATLRPPTLVAFFVRCIGTVASTGWIEGFNRTWWFVFGTIHSPILRTAGWPTTGIATFVGSIRTITIAWWPDVTHGLFLGALLFNTNYFCMEMWKLLWTEKSETDSASVLAESTITFRKGNACDCTTYLEIIGWIATFGPSALVTSCIRCISAVTWTNWRSSTALSRAAITFRNESRGTIPRRFIAACWKSSPT